MGNPVRIRVCLVVVDGDELLPVPHYRWEPLMNTENLTDQTGWSEETSRVFIDYSRYFVPERDHQMRIIAALLSYLERPCVILELCCGEGLLAEVLLDTFPTFTVQGLDGSVEMLQRARERLVRFENRFQCSTFDLASADWRKLEFPIHAVVSSMAIHHLTGPQKQELFFDVYQMLVDDGAFVIADIVEHTNEMARRLAAETWDQVVRKRSMELDGNTEAFEFFEREGWNTFWYLDPEDIDKPSPLFDQLRWLEKAGFEDVDVHWMLAGHAVFSARKTKNG
jgi:tRNA (cmo5U34)-methyltransferase